MDNRKEHKKDENSAARFFAGLLIGSLIGGVTMLMVAPQKGKKTRAQILQKSLELRDQTSEVMEDVAAQTAAKARQISRAVNQHAKELERHGQAIYDDQKKFASQIVGAAKTTLGKSSE